MTPRTDFANTLMEYERMAGRSQGDHQSRAPVYFGCPTDCHFKKTGAGLPAYARSQFGEKTGLAHDERQIDLEQLVGHLQVGARGIVIRLEIGNGG